MRKLDQETLDMVDVDFPDIGPITEETRRRNVQEAQSGRYGSLPVRWVMGKFYTDKEYEAFRKKVLKRHPLADLINNLRLRFSYY